MKKTMLSWAIFLAVGALWSCSDTGNYDTSKETTVSGNDTTGIGTPSTTNSMNSQDTTNATAANQAPLDTMDRTFVMEAASGGMMEVELGNMAQQKASNPRVKEFAAMMVRDHTASNNELKTFAQSRNVMLTDSMMAKHKAHVNHMTSISGKAFDRAYMNMMNTAHSEDISKFKKASTGAKDANLMAWAAKTLPVLQMHKDSAQAITKTIK